MVNEVKIKKAVIHGINNPKIHIEGKTKKKNINFKVYGDNEILPICNIITDSANNFYFEAIVPKNSKEVKIYIIDKGVEKLIYDVRNSKFKRIFNKIVYIIKKALSEVIFETYEGVGINKAEVVGIKKPLLVVTGTLENKNIKFEILANKKKIKNTIEIDKNNNFKIECKIPKNTKKAFLVVIYNNNRKILLEIKTLKLKKILKRIKEIIKIKISSILLFYTPGIGIQVAQITGIKNPLFHIHGTTKNSNANFKIYVDNKEQQYERIVIGDVHTFCIENEIPQSAKKVEVYYINKDKKIRVALLKNRIINRIFKKIFHIMHIVIVKIKIFFILICKAIKISWTKYHFLIPPKLLKKYIIKFVKELKGVSDLFYNPFYQNDYLNWLSKNETCSEFKELKYNPLISVLIPVYNVNKKYLSECLNSILNQTYQNFEICIADDCSSKKETIDTLREYEKKDKRIKVNYRKENGHISKASNTALEMANGEFIILIDNDDTISPNAFYEIVKVLNENKELDMIYSDEDKLDLNGKRCYPHFKPDFSPDTLLSLNYICHLTTLRTSIVKQIGGFIIGLEGSQDHDLFLRFTEKTNKIYHISKILYHWRMIKTSTASGIKNKSYATDKGKLAIENALKRRNIHGIVEKDNKSTYYIVNYKIIKEPKISIIIPTRDHSIITEQCLKSIYKNTTYKNFEILLVNNNSEEESTFKLFEKYKKKYDNFKVININTEFNYAYINNEAVKKSSGEYILLLNNDTEVITPNWLDIMVGYASQSHIGAVGAKLLYPDMTIQHAGVIMGLGGVASHAYIGFLRDDLGTYGRLRVPYNYSAVTAACLMIKKEKYNQINGLEEELKVAYNDVDFCLKLLQKGYYNICLPQVELIHHESKSRGMDTTKEKYLRFVREQEFMYKKWKIKESGDAFYNDNYSYKGWFVLDKNREEKRYE